MRPWRMKKYDSYKDSGVEWIGEVPGHWDVYRLKWLFHNLDNLREPISAEKRERNNPQYDYYGASGIIDKIDYYNVDDKVLLIGEDGANLVFRNLPLIYKAEGKFWVNNHSHILKNKKGIDYEYMFYTLESADYSNFITGSAQPKLSQSNLEQQELPVPPLSEQQSIATYLDKKCFQIDKVISTQQKRIALLQELKQSVITHAVTKGLNPNVEMKDSGVEWIGEVPKHWKVAHMKRILKEKMQYGANEPAESDDTSLPRYIRITDITANGELRPETFKSLEEKKAKDYLLEMGDMLFARSGATVGKTFLFNSNIKACFAGYLIKASCNRKMMIPEFLYYYTLSGAYDCWKSSVFIQSTIQNIGADKYQLMYMPIPTIEEQIMIVGYVREKCKTFDASISQAQHQVDLLQEHKQSLITEVVTGKRKVC